MNWLQKISQIQDLQQMLTSVASGVAGGRKQVPDIGMVMQYVSNLGPDPNICEMINTIGQKYPGSESIMSRIASAARCQDQSSVENENIPGMDNMPQMDNSMEMPSIEID